MNQKEIENAILKYSDMVYKLAVSILKNKADSEDIYQEVMIKFCNNIENFENEAHEKAWIIRVTINQCKSLLRMSWFKNRNELDENLSYLDKENDEVYYAVSELPTKYRIVIYLFYYEKYKISEISEILNISESAIKSQLSKARNMLKKSLKGGIDNE